MTEAAWQTVSSPKKRQSQRLASAAQSTASHSGSSTPSKMRGSFDVLDENNFASNAASAGRTPMTPTRADREKVEQEKAKQAAINKFYAAKLKTPKTPKQKLQSASTRPSPLSSPALDMATGYKNIPKHVELRALMDLYMEFKSRYPTRQDTHLQALLEHIEAALSNTGISTMPFGLKSFSLSELWTDGAYPYFPAKVKEWMEDTLQQYPDEVLQKFFVGACISLLDIHRKASTVFTLQTSLGYQYMVQLIARTAYYKIQLSAAAADIIKHYPNFTANPSIAHTFLWILNQFPASYESIQVWSFYFLPVYSSAALSSAATVQSLALDWIDAILDGLAKLNARSVKSLAFPIENLMTLAFLSFSSNSAIANNKKGQEYIERITVVYEIIKGLVMTKTPLKIPNVKLFDVYLALTSCEEVAVQLEALETCVDLLGQDTALFDHVLREYDVSLNEIRVLVEFITENWERCGSKMDLDKLKTFLGDLLESAKNLSKKENWASSRSAKNNQSKSRLQELQIAIQNGLATLKKVQPKQTSSVSWMWYLFLIVLVVSAISLNLHHVCVSRGKLPFDAQTLLPPTVCKTYKSVVEHPQVAQLHNDAVFLYEKYDVDGHLKATRKFVYDQVGKAKKLANSREVNEAWKTVVQKSNVYWKQLQGYLQEGKKIASDLMVDMLEWTQKNFETIQKNYLKF